MLVIVHHILKHNYDLLQFANIHMTCFDMYDLNISDQNYNYLYSHNIHILKHNYDLLQFASIRMICFDMYDLNISDQNYNYPHFHNIHILKHCTITSIIFLYNQQQ